MHIPTAVVLARRSLPCLRETLAALVTVAWLGWSSTPALAQPAVPPTAGNSPKPAAGLLAVSLDSVGAAAAGLDGGNGGPDAQTSAQPVTAGWNDGFTLQSPDGDYRLQIGLLLHADGRFALNDEDDHVVDTFALRRVRPYLRGRVARHFEFYLNPDFAGGTLVVQDAYVDTRFSPAFVVRLGKAKAPFGLERLVPVASILFFERALPTALVPNRDVGVQVLGDLPGGYISYAAGVMNGVPDGGSGDTDTNDGKDLAGRIVIRPFGAPSKRPLSGLAVAFAATTGNQSGPLATIRTTSLLQNFLTYTGATADGRLTRFTPGATYYFKRTSAIAEYAHTQVPMRRGSSREEISHDAWQIAGTFLLTGGDTVSDRGVRPQHNFDFGNGHLGALQVAARYHQLSADEETISLGLASPGSSRQAKAWTVGLNWYLNPVLKYVVNFERTEFDGNDALARHAENAIAFRAQVNF
jgi:phosphate-selective porin OprO/OprP